jgi:hypothetical protein
VFKSSSERDTQIRTIETLVSDIAMATEGMTSKYGRLSRMEE